MSKLLQSITNYLTIVRRFKGLSYPKTLFRYFVRYGSRFKVRVEGYTFFFPIRDIKRFHALLGFSPHEEYTQKWSPVMIDIGAHVGRVSIPFSKLFKVYAYEPDPDNFECLEQNIKDNKANVKAFNLAVYKEGKLKFSQDERSTMGGVSESGAITVQGTTLERIFKENKIDKCTLLKIDCEGGEYEILSNLPNEIWKKIENMIIEVHPHPKGNKYIANLVKSKGFKVEKKDVRGEYFELYCT